MLIRKLGLAARIVNALETKDSFERDKARAVLEQAKDALDAAIAFCEGQHKRTPEGFSGSYLFSAITRALDFDGSVIEFSKYLVQQRDELQGILNGFAASSSDLKQLFESISNLPSRGGVTYSLENEPERWRL